MHNKDLKKNNIHILIIDDDEKIRLLLKQFLENNDFKIKFNKPLIFNQDESIEQITSKLNQNLEKMILKNPDQWIWTHNRWR